MEELAFTNASYNLSCNCRGLQQMAEGKLNPDWKVIYPVDFWTFGDLLSTQMLEYDPIKRKYPENAEMRRYNSQKRKD